MNSKIKILSSDLIKKCDEFLNEKIDSKGLTEYATKLIVDESFDLDDERVDYVIHEWENYEMSYPLNKTNVRLWKEYLKTGIDKLAEFNDWNIHINKQKEICIKNKSNWIPINKKLMVGIANDLTKNPLNGLRHPKEGITTGWYIWTGEWSDKDDFFKPICAEHLLQIRPQIIKYFGLDIGFRFLIDSNGYEDVWYDSELKNI